MFFRDEYFSGFDILKNFNQNFSISKFSICSSLLLRSSYVSTWHFSIWVSHSGTLSSFNLYSPKTFCSRPSDCQVFCYICSFLVWGKFWLKLQENADFLFIFQLRSIPWVKRGRAVHGWFATKLTSWKPFKEALMNLKLNSTLESYSLLKKKKKSPKRAKVSLRATGPG